MHKEQAKELLNEAFSQYNCKHINKDLCDCKSNPFALEQAIDKIFFENEKYEKELENTTKALMAYVITLHDSFNKALASENLELTKDILFKTFPMLQGSRNQSNFRKLGEDSTWDDVPYVVDKLLKKRI